MLKRILLIFVAIALAAFFQACGDKTPPKPSYSSAPKVSVPSGPAYDASLSDGIDFTKPGYPAFVAEVQGISGYEPWGRWTEGDRAIIRMKENLPKSFYLELIVKGAFGPNAKAPIRIRVGASEQSFTVTLPIEIFRFEFSADQAANTIEIIPPKPTSPKSMNVNRDVRLLGIGLVKLRIIQK